MRMRCVCAVCAGTRGVVRMLVCVCVHVCVCGRAGGWAKGEDVLRKGRRELVEESAQTALILNTNHFPTMKKKCQ